jgi:hypothetical protein
MNLRFAMMNENSIFKSDTEDTEFLKFLSVCSVPPWLSSGPKMQNFCGEPPKGVLSQMTSEGPDGFNLKD